MPLPVPRVLSSSRTCKLPDTLSRLGLAGGAVYDALAALAAKEHGSSPRDPGRAGTRHL
jgi:toxin FitB